MNENIVDAGFATAWKLAQDWEQAVQEKAAGTDDADRAANQDRAVTDSLGRYVGAMEVLSEMLGVAGLVGYQDVLGKKKADMSATRRLLTEWARRTGQDSLKVLGFEPVGA